MPEARLRAIKEVDDMILNGEVSSFAEWEAVVKHPNNPGVQNLEGAELEDSFAPDECRWLSAEEEHAIAKEDMELIEDRVVAEAASQDDASGLDLVPIVSEASLTAARLARLKRLRAEALDLAIPAAVFTMDRQIRMQERSLAAGVSSSSKIVSKVLQAHMEAKEVKSRHRVRQHQLRAQKVKKAAHNFKVKRQLALRAKEKVRKMKAELAAKLDALPKTFSAKECGLPGQEGLRARVRCLERLKLRSPALSFEDDARWVAVRNRYCKRFRSRLRPTSGQSSST